MIGFNVDSQILYIHYYNSGFNSKMVRFKVKSLQNRVSLLLVSIPKWYDFTMSTSY